MIHGSGAGNAGRLSTDLDFAAEDDATATLVLDTLDSAEVDGLTTSVRCRFLA